MIYCVCCTLREDAGGFWTVAEEMAPNWCNAHEDVINLVHWLSKHTIVRVQLCACVLYLYLESARGCWKPAFSKEQAISVVSVVACSCRQSIVCKMQKCKPEAD